MTDVLAFLKSVPAIIGFLVELKKLWDQEYQTYERKKKMQEATDAIKKARTTGDTSDIEALFRGSRAD